MHRPSAAAWILIGLVSAAAASALDLRRIDANTLVIYTTPALKDVLENFIVPSFEEKSGIDVLLVYVPPAGAQYYRVLMTRDRPEADLFLHASPLFIEKGYASGIFDAYSGPEGAETGETPQRRAPDGQQIWTAFATSPLVEVYAPSFAAPPDLNRTDLRFGLPHPLLSNNGIYAALFYDETNPAAGQDAVRRTVVQPSNARATIGGVAEGSFDVTLGYEAVARLYQSQGAKIAFGLPVIEGRTTTTNVLFCVGLVHGHPHNGTTEFIAHLFNTTVQQGLANYALRPTVPGHQGPADGLVLAGARMIDYDWSNWAALETRLSEYAVKG